MIDKALSETNEEIERLRKRVRELEGSSAAPLAYTVAGAAEALGTGEHNIRALIRCGELPAFKLEHSKQRYMIYRADIEDFIRRRKEETKRYEAHAV